MTKYKELGRWKIGELLGQGGNGRVYLGRDGDTQVAIKVLSKPERAGRFSDEIEGMKRLKGINGVLPLLDSCVPDRPTTNNPAWFAMPLAVPLKEALGLSPSPIKVISALRDIASVLANLHEKGFSHRDIKPDNLFNHADKWALGDFGLIEFEGKSHETLLGERIGPIHFIAPEMLLGLIEVDGKAADVFSLSKTLWVLLTGANFPVPGAYNAGSAICQLKSYVKVDQSSNLDRLIEQCTVMESKSRPSMRSVERELSAWLSERKLGVIGSRANSAIPKGVEWAEVIEASIAQKLVRETHNELNATTHAAVKEFYAQMRPLYLEIRTHLESAGLSDISGPDEGTSPPGVRVLFPIKTSAEKQLTLEFRAWFNPDWENLERKFVNVMACTRVNISKPSGNIQEEMYRIEDSFIIGGSAANSFVEKVKVDALHLLPSWLEKCAKKWAILG